MCLKISLKHNFKISNNSTILKLRPFSVKFRLQFGPEFFVKTPVRVKRAVYFFLFMSRTSVDKNALLFGSFHRGRSYQRILNKNILKSYKVRIERVIHYKRYWLARFLSTIHLLKRYVALYRLFSFSSSKGLLLKEIYNIFNLYKHKIRQRSDFVRLLNYSLKTKQLRRLKLVKKVTRFKFKPSEKSIRASAGKIYFNLKNRRELLKDKRGLKKKKHNTYIDIKKGGRINTFLKSKKDYTINRLKKLIKFKKLIKSNKKKDFFNYKKINKIKLISFNTNKNKKNIFTKNNIFNKYSQYNNFYKKKQRNEVILIQEKKKKKYIKLLIKKTNLWKFLYKKGSKFIKK